MLVHPNNPTGSHVKETEVSALASLGLPLIADEVFLPYPLVGEPRASGRPATVQVRVFSAVWYRVSDDRSLLFAVIRNWPGHTKDDVLVSTDLGMTAE